MDKNKIPGRRPFVVILIVSMLIMGFIAYMIISFTTDPHNTRKVAFPITGVFAFIIITTIIVTFLRASKNMSEINDKSRQYLSSFISEKKTCPDCRGENPSDAKYCNRCGAKLVRECQYCDQENKSDAEYCSKCGAKLI